MRQIALAILLFLMSVTTGCQILRTAPEDIVTLPQRLQRSDNSKIKAASRIGQKLGLKQARRFMKKQEKERFKEDPSYDFWEFRERLDKVHNQGSPEPIEDGDGYIQGYQRQDYQLDVDEDKLRGDKDDEGEEPIPIMGNDEIIVNDEGSVKADLPKLYERWLGKWPFKDERDTDLLKPKYKFDVHAGASFDTEYFIDTYRLELGLSRYSRLLRERQWRLSVDTKYESDHGDWTAFVQWTLILK